MAQYIGFGNGSDGAVTLSGTDAPIDSSCSGTAASTSLSATNASFAAGQIILIHQSRGSAAGTWEINQIGSYSAGTITTSIPLANTYTDSGADQAQVLVLKQYTTVTVSGTFTAKAWDGNVGGILAFLANSTVTITGTVTASEKGYRGGAIADTSGSSWQGEGTAGAGGQSTAANGNGGGGAFKRASGGSGGHVSAGTIGNLGNDGGTVGQPGGTAGSSDLSTMVFGGAGAGGGSSIGVSNRSGVGGNGGGIICIWGGTVEVTGAITCTGQNGANVIGSDGSGGSPGAGGSVLINGMNVSVGSNIVTSLGSTVGGNKDGGGAVGATPASDGRIVVNGCTVTGTTNPSATSQVGGQSYCTVKHGIL